MSEKERAYDMEDFEARKDDTAAASTWAGREAEGAAADDL
jgi:hypothetical protein